MYKVRLQRYLLKLATNWQSDKAFLLTSGFCPQRVVCPWPGAIYLWINIKNVYKIRIQSCLKLATNGRMDKGFLLTSTVCPQGFFALALGLYMFIKSDFEEIILKLQHMGKEKRSFCWHQHLSPRGRLHLPWGYIHV